MPNPQTILFTDTPPALGLLFSPADLHLAAPRIEENHGERVLIAPFLKAIDLSATHGVNVTDEKIDQVIDSYDPENIEAATLNFDHVEGGPAHGECTKVWKENGIAMSRWENLSAEAIEGIQSGRWKRRSAEIRYSHVATGGWYFTGLALLGAASPAVFGLPPALLLSHKPHRLQLNVAAKENPMPPETANTATPDAPALAAAADDVLPPTEAEEAEETEATPATPAVTEEEEVAAQSLAGDTPTPIVMVDPPAAVAAATLSADSASATETLRLSAENAALSARLTAANRTVLLHQVQAELAACKGVSPGVLRTGLAEAIVELRLMENKQPLIALLSTATADGKVKAVPIADIFLAAFAALPPIAALEATPLATRDADPAENGDHRTAAERQAHLRAGLQDDAYLQLARKYGFNQLVNN